jgi:photosystem II stability/assembly factor-like uncharacterized protein
MSCRRTLARIGSQGSNNRQAFREKNMRCALRLLAALASPIVLWLGPGAAVVAGPGYWTGNGPDGGSVYDVLYHPTAPSIVYASTRGGLFRSLDGGGSWQRIERGLSGGVSWNAQLILDRESPATLWAVDIAGRLFRSSDGGDNWAPTGWSAPTGQWVQALADGAGSSGRLFAALSDGSVLRSDDGGVSFAATGFGVPSPVRELRLFTDPVRPNALVAGATYSSSGPGPSTPALLRSLNDGATWSTLLQPPGYTGFTPVQFSAGPGSRLYAAIDGQLWRSVDDGASWTQPGQAVEQVRAHPTLADTVFLGQRLTDGNANLRRSSDGGLSASPLANGLFPNPGYGATAAVNRIVLHPSYPAVPQLFVASQDGGLYRSNDDGATFSTAQVGLSGINVRALAVLPNPAFSGSGNRVLFAGYGDAFYASPGLFWSSSSGNTWAPRNNGLRGYQIRGMAIDRTTVGSGSAALASTVLYASGRSAPNPLIRNSGLYKSTDGGANWVNLSGGLPTTGSPPSTNLGTVRSIVLDPRSCASPPPTGPCTSGPLQTVYATATGFRQPGMSGGVPVTAVSHRVIKSTDAGAKWTSADAGLPVQYPPGGGAPSAEVIPVPLVVDPVNPLVLYVGTFASTSTDPALGAPNIPSGVFKSTDGGASWVHMSAGLPRYPGTTDTAFDVLALAIHPSVPTTLWATAVNLFDQVNPRRGYVYKSVDGGLSWSNSSTGLNTDVDLRALTVDAGNPNVLYAAGAGTVANPGSVFKSEDGGATWRSLSIGLPADAALALSIDPFDPAILYAGTNSAVWQIQQLPDADADGAPDALEDAAPNGGDGNADGIRDALQSQVGSAQPRTAARGVPAQPFTISVISGSDAGCQRINDVQGVAAADNGIDTRGPGQAWAYPLELVRFELRGCSAAVVELRFHAPVIDFSSPAWAMRMYGPSQPGLAASIGWHDLSSLATRSGPRTWRLDLRANAFGSYRPSEDAILFMGGPAFFDERVFSNGFEAAN